MQKTQITHAFPCVVQSQTSAYLPLTPPGKPAQRLDIKDG